MPKPSNNIIRIYVARLASSNNGYLHGAWINAIQNADMIKGDIAAMLASSPVKNAEEYAIHDHEGFEGIKISEYACIEKVARRAAFVGEHGALGAGLLTHFADDIEYAETTLRDCYHGQFASLADYMEEMITESITISERVRYYIDWEAMGYDAELSGDVFVIKIAHGEVHVFSGT